MKWEYILLAVSAVLLLAACVRQQKQKTYKQITQEEAARMMEKDDGHVVVDVRRQDEFDAGHIPGAVLIPNEVIGTERPVELPDLKQVILVYCRSGNRSKQAAQKLADMGYENVYEFGGILDWKGETVAVDFESIAEAIRPTATLVIEANGRILYAHPENNASAREFIDRLSRGRIEVQAREYGGFEKTGSLPWELERNDERIGTRPGDIILYEGNQLSLMYGTNTWEYTRLARIDGKTREQLLEILGEGDVLLALWVEWSE